jgi:RNA 2',3'-cyclic 3'-phosphodiesterase
MIRTFIALELPETARRTLSNLQSGLRSELPSVRWVRPEGIHLTLKFLGDIREDQVAAIGAAMGAAIEAVAREQGPLTLAIKGLGVFPGVRKARVIWAGLSGDTENLMALQTAVDTALEGVGFAPQRRRFKAHLTLGRFKQPLPAHKLVAVLEQRGDFTPLEMHLERVVLYRSELRPQGARYTILSHASLNSDALRAV